MSIQRYPMLSRDFNRRFWYIPDDAIPFWTSTNQIGSLAAGVQSNVEASGQVPPDVNGLRIAKLYINTGAVATGMRVALYERNPRPPGTENIRVYNEATVGAGVDPFGYDIAWLLRPSTFWQLTVRNVTAGTINSTWVGLGGWYF